MPPLSGCSVARSSRLVWDQEVAGSNPATPTKANPCCIKWQGFFYDQTVPARISADKNPELRFSKILAWSRFIKVQSCALMCNCRTYPVGDITCILSFRQRFLHLRSKISASSDQRFQDCIFFCRSATLATLKNFASAFSKNTDSAAQYHFFYLGVNPTPPALQVQITKSADTVIIENLHLTHHPLKKCAMKIKKIQIFYRHISFFLLRGKPYAPCPTGPNYEIRRYLTYRKSSFNELIFSNYHFTTPTVQQALKSVKDLKNR